MKRTGECNQCGECCRYGGYFQLRNPGLLEWADARGFNVTEFPNGKARVLIPNICPHLTHDGCDLHGTSKPEVCREFPSRPEHLLPGCGFSFTDDGGD